MLKNIFILKNIPQGVDDGQFCDTATDADDDNADDNALDNFHTKQHNSKNQPTKF